MLIVDDRPIDVALRAAVVKTVEGLGPVGFLDPAEALCWCEREAPILVLVDHAMPGTLGDDFVRRLRGVVEGAAGEGGARATADRRRLPVRGQERRTEPRPRVRPASRRHADLCRNAPLD